MVGMKFTKMHGLGNDYVYVNCCTQRVEDPPGLARAISDRHTGVGSDGLILIRPSRAQMCGNGIRCLAKYVLEHGLAAGPELSIDTDDGVKLATCEVVDGLVRSVRIDVGLPALAASALPSTIGVDRIIDYPLLIDAVTYVVTCVSIGNPHAVIFVDDPGAVALEVVGPRFENAPEFPERINTHFVRVDSSTHVTMRTWERGSGATRACGTGACAVCVAGAVTQRTQRRITATLPGGDLQIEWADNDHVHMTGPAVEVFTGVWPG